MVEDQLIVEKSGTDDRQMLYNQLFSEPDHPLHRKTRIDRENPLTPPGARSRSQVWPDLNGLKDVHALVSTEKFRYHDLFSHAKDSVVGGDHIWVRSLLNDSLRTGHYGDVRTESWFKDETGSFMNGATGCYSVSNSFKAEEVEPDGGCLVVAEDAEVGSANFTAHFLVGPGYDITRKNSKARRTDNISEFRGDWDELKRFFRGDGKRLPELSHEEKCILGVTGFEKNTYSSVDEIRRELAERRIEVEEKAGRIQGVEYSEAFENLLYLDALSDWDVIGNVFEPASDASWRNVELEGLNSMHNDEVIGRMSLVADVPYDTAEIGFRQMRKPEDLMYAHERRPESLRLARDKARVYDMIGDCIGSIRELHSLKYGAVKELGWPEHRRKDFDEVLLSLEDVMDTQAVMAEVTMEQGLETGDVEQHIDQAESLVKGDLDFENYFEIDDRSPTNCNICSRYVDTVAGYMSAVKALEDRARRRNVPLETLDKGLKISYSLA